MKRIQGIHRIGLLAALAGVSAAALANGCAAAPDGEDEHEVDGPEPVDQREDAANPGTVAQAIANTCSTASVKKLSLQIIEEGNCIKPGAFAKVPDLGNVSFGPAVFPYLEKPARDRLVQSLDAHPGWSMTVNSMLRTVAQQYMLYRWSQQNRCGIGLAATPGNSNHETGLAMDINQFSTWKGSLANHGFKWFGSADKVHFDYVGPGAVSHKGLDVKAFQRLWNRNHPNDKIAVDGSWGPSTASRMAKSPAGGFSKGAICLPEGGGAPTAGMKPAPAAVSWAEGRLDVFARDEDDHLVHRSMEAGTWSSWEDLGGKLTSDPSAVSLGEGRIDVFARGAQNQLLHRALDAGAWSGWEDLGGTLTSDPAAVISGPGRIDVFARGGSDQLVHGSLDGAWSGWESLGGTLKSGPTAASWEDGRIDVFARGGGDDLVHKWLSAGTWKGWEHLGGTLSSAPTAVSWGPGRIDVFARGGGDDLVHKWFKEGSWSSWEHLGGTLYSEPRASSWGPGRIDVFARGGGDELVHKRFDAGWSSWQHLGDLP